MRFRSLLGIVGVFTLMLGSSATAQTSTGTIRGYVKDQDGVPLGGAEVQATNLQNGTVRSATSLENGSYVLPGLVPASYQVVARHIGHTPAQRPVDVLIGATLLADFALAAGPVELAPVTVTGQSP